MIRKQELLQKSKTLSINSQIELYNFLKSVDITCMENANGVFFDLSTIDISQVNLINNKLEILQQFEFYTDSNVFNEKTEHTIVEKDAKTDDLVTSTIDNEKNKSEDQSSYLNMNLDNYLTKVAKKNNHLKYSVAKKKYNKQTLNECKKIEDSDLNKLEKEEYIY
jgi:hypothetical protein